MPSKLNNKDILENILLVLDSKPNYSLIEIIAYNGSRSILSMKCNLDGCIWNPSYTRFVHNKSNCPRCSGSEILNDKMVIERLDEVTKNTNISYEILSIVKILKCFLLFFALIFNFNYFFNSFCIFTM